MINTVARAGMGRPYSLHVQSATDSSLLRNFAAAGAAFAAGLATALPGLDNRAETIRSVGAGLIAESPSWGERLSALAFQIGGWTLVDLIRLLSGALPWFFGLLVLFWGAGRLTGNLRIRARQAVWILSLLVFTIGLSAKFQPASPPVIDLRLLAPISLVDLARSAGGRVYLNPSAAELVAPFGRDLLDGSLTQQSRSELSSNPQKWRNEDRTKPFSSVLISGRVHEAKPLIRHLLDSPDWYLARVDNMGILFLRGRKPDLAASPVPEFSSPRDRAVYLAQYALNLEAAGFRTLATSSMDEALNLAGKDYEILFRASSLSASQDRWELARKQAAAAAKANPGAFEANYLLALSLLETRAFDKSFEATSVLVKKYPLDSTVLALHARASRAVHDYAEETKTLEKILALAGKNGVSTSHIHVYLAQSWAQRSFPDQALRHYKAALDGGLSPNEARDVRSAIATIEQNQLKK